MGSKLAQWAHSFWTWASVPTSTVLVGTLILVLGLLIISVCSPGQSLGSLGLERWMQKQSRGSGFVSKFMRWAGPTCMELYRLCGDFVALIALGFICLGLYLMFQWRGF